MEVITIMASARGTCEETVANWYTYRQLFHFAHTAIKEKMYVPNLFARAFFPVGKNDPKVNPKSVGNPPSSSGRLPSWFSPTSNRYEIIDLDGPLSTIKAKTKEYFGGLSGKKSNKSNKKKRR